MEAVEYLRQRKRLCEVQTKGPEGCRECPLWNGATGCVELQEADPEKAVRIVADWAERNPVERETRLTSMEQIFVKIYIEHGYIWAARDKAGELKLYRKEPKRMGDAFKSLSPAANSCRTALPHMLPAITWENSPACLPKMLERKE